MSELLSAAWQSRPLRLGVAGVAIAALSIPTYEHFSAQPEAQAPVVAEAAGAWADPAERLAATPDAPATNLGACTAYTLAEIDFQGQLAKDCLDTMDDGHVALVIYDGRTEAGKTLASDVEKIVAESTDGKVTVTVDTLTASPQAMAARKANAAAAGDCFDFDAASAYGSSIADREMKLEAYDYVLGATDELACDDDILGVADTVTTFRHADILRHGYDRSTSQGQQDERTDRARTAAHELLHLFGLGHYGEVRSVAPDGTMYDGLNFAEVTTTKDTLQLDRFIMPHVDYDEYGPYDVMGSPSPRTPLLDLSPVTLDCLNKPQAVLDGPEALRVKYLDPNERVKLTVKEAKKKQYAQLELNEPLKVVVGDDGQESVYDSVAIVPQLNPDTAKTTMQGFETVLVNTEHCRAVSAGQTGILGYYDHMKVRAGNQTVTANITSQAITLTTKVS